MRVKYPLGPFELEGTRSELEIDSIRGLESLVGPPPADRRSAERYPILLEPLPLVTTRDGLVCVVQPVSYWAEEIPSGSRVQCLDINEREVTTLLRSFIGGVGAPRHMASVDRCLQSFVETPALLDLFVEKYCSRPREATATILRNRLYPGSKPDAARAFLYREQFLLPEPGEKATAEPDNQGEREGVNWNERRLAWNEYATKRGHGLPRFHELLRKAIRHARALSETEAHFLELLGHLRTRLLKGDFDALAAKVPRWDAQLKKRSRP